MSSGSHNIVKKVQDSILSLFRYDKDKIVGNQSKSEQRQEAHLKGDVYNLLSSKTEQYNLCFVLVFIFCNYQIRIRAGLYFGGAGENFQDLPDRAGWYFCSC